VRINVQLIDAATDEHLWADTYDRRLTAANIFAIQSEIATAIADALRTTLSAQERGLLDVVPTESMAALEAYFRGRQRMVTRSTAGIVEAVEDFNRAIELDPDFALAYVRLANCYDMLYEGGLLTLDEMLAKTQPAVDKALALDDQLAESHAALGALEFSRMDFEAADVAYKLALELNPNYASAYHGYALLLLDGLGRRDQALEAIKKAAELDPRSPSILQNLAVGFDSVGRFDESLAWYRKSIEISPDFLSGHEYTGFHYWTAKGQLDEAVRWFRKCVSLDPEGPLCNGHLSWLFLDLGDLDGAAYWSERLSEIAPKSFYANRAMELLHLYRGDLSSALEHGREDERGSIMKLMFSTFEPVRTYEMRAGRYLEARVAMAKIAPELLNKNLPKIGDKSYPAAIDLAWILFNTGDEQRADWLLEGSLQYIQQIPRLGFYGYDVADVQIYALQGKKQKALSVLRQAIDQGWRRLWWYYLKQDPTLESLHDEPEFQAMVEEIEADMAAQLERVREMERNGELEPIPEIPATTH
jgi:tetratricopeptide (TPR) repeat protein